ncbi:CotH kinase family protein, partial [Akkermansiaceae bacterium]|nr:CotH kinase family protein [Akkermansiaceae bacterium]
LVGHDSRLKNVPALIFSGDGNETFFNDHGIMAINGGSYLDDQWVENGPSSFNIPMKRGSEFERPLFVEFYHPDGSLSFREEAGVRLSASDFSRPRLILDDPSASPWSNDPTQKPSFNLYFRDDYGTPELESNWIEQNYSSSTYSKLPAYLIGGQYPVNDFKQLRVRAGKNDIQNPFIVDEAVRRMFVQMGQKGSVGIINTLYVNGEYKGFFNMCERLREPFMQAHHGGNEDWDVRQVNDYPNGDSSAWNDMISILQRSDGGELSLSDWQEALTYLDPVNMADYFLINIYGATWDWPQNNWVGARERSPEGRYRLYVWDAEGSYQNQGYFNSVSHNSFSSDLLAKSDTLSSLFQLLIKCPEWRLIFADRINKHLFHDGVLDHRNRANSTFRQHLLALEEDYEPLLDFGFGQSVNLGFYNTWSSATTGRRRYLFGSEGAPAQGGDRTDFADNDLWPGVSPPEFSQHGGGISAGMPVTISSGGGTQIFYTVDGSDPREFGGAIQAGLSAYSGALTFSPGRTVVKARAYEGGSATWSALTEVEFVVDLAVPSASNLVISEFLYHPAAPSTSEAAAGHTDQDDFEFIEIMNTSPTDTIDLTKVSFTGGVSFSFAGSEVTELAPGERALVVSKLAAFLVRYAGVTHPVAGQFDGGLSNSSEAITLSVNDPTPAVIHSFVYRDESPWPACGDGLGYSLALLAPNTNPDHTDPANWQCSDHFGGELNVNPLDFDYATWTDFNFSSSQLLDTNIVGSDRDPDGDGRSNFLEFAFGTDPNLSDFPQGGPFLASVEILGVDYVLVEFTRSGFTSNVTYSLAASPDLTEGSWTQVPEGQIAAATSVLLPDGRVRESWRVTTSISDLSQRYFRLAVTLP